MRSLKRWLLHPLKMKNLGQLRPPKRSLKMNLSRPKSQSQNQSPIPSLSTYCSILRSKTSPIHRHPSQQHPSQQSLRLCSRKSLSPRRSSLSLIHLRPSSLSLIRLRRLRSLSRHLQRPKLAHRRILPLLLRATTPLHLRAHRKLQPRPLHLRSHLGWPSITCEWHLMA